MTGNIFQRYIHTHKYSVPSQRVIITRSRNRKIRSYERNCDRWGDFPKHEQPWNVLGQRLMAGTLSEINIFCFCAARIVPLWQERLVRRYRHRLRGLHRFDETYPRNITFLLMELNAQIHPVGFGFRSRNPSFPLRSLPSFIVFSPAAGRRLSAKRLILQRVENPDGITANVDLWSQQRHYL